MCQGQKCPKCGSASIMYYDRNAIWLCGACKRVYSSSMDEIACDSVSFHKLLLYLASEQEMLRDELIKAMPDPRPLLSLEEDDEEENQPKRISPERRIVYQEVYCMLQAIQPFNRERIPQHILDFIDRARDRDYVPDFDILRSADEAKKISRDALAMFAGLNLEYMCNSEKKEELMRTYEKNGLAYRTDQTEWLLGRIRAAEPLSIDWDSLSAMDNFGRMCAEICRALQILPPELSEAMFTDVDLIHILCGRDYDVFTALEGKLLVRNRMTDKMEYSGTEETIQMLRGLAESNCCSEVFDPEYTYEWKSDTSDDNRSVSGEKADLGDTVPDHPVSDERYEAEAETEGFPEPEETPAPGKVEEETAAPTKKQYDVAKLIGLDEQSALELCSDQQDNIKSVPCYIEGFPAGQVISAVVGDDGIVLYVNREFKKYPCAKACPPDGSYESTHTVLWFNNPDVVDAYFAVEETDPENKGSRTLCLIMRGGSVSSVSSVVWHYSAQEVQDLIDAGEAPCSLCHSCDRMYCGWYNGLYDFGRESGHSVPYIVKPVIERPEDQDDCFEYIFLYCDDFWRSWYWDMKTSFDRIHYRSDQGESKEIDIMIHSMPKELLKR